MLRVLLISTYELGRQPFGLASPAAWLRQASVPVRVDCLDLSLQQLDDDLVRSADLVGFYLPMHTATRIATAVIARVRELNPTAELCAWGLYAPVAAKELTKLGVSWLVGGEFEAELEQLAVDLSRKRGSIQSAPRIVHDRLSFRVPDRSGLPELSSYARLCLPSGEERIVGATEASRGCKHRCRHCPVVPIYNGRFRIVDSEVVLADIEQQVAAGATHITFGDPDFLNGPGHARRIVRSLHERFPRLTYDATMKVEHLLQHADLLPVLRNTGCALVTSAVESLDDRVLELLDKGHTRADFERALTLCRAADLPLQPTFVAFHPWTRLDGYLELLDALVDLDLVGAVAPIQLAIRLLIPRRSRLLELPEIQEVVGNEDPALFGYPWRHPDPRVDQLQRDIETLVAERSADTGRGELFQEIQGLARAANDGLASSEAQADEQAAAWRRDRPSLPSAATIPYLTEPWYC